MSLCPRRKHAREHTCVCVCVCTHTCNTYMHTIHIWRQQTRKYTRICTHTYLVLWRQQTNVQVSKQTSKLLLVQGVLEKFRLVHTHTHGGVFDKFLLVQGVLEKFGRLGAADAVLFQYFVCAQASSERVVWRVERRVERREESQEYLWLVSLGVCTRKSPGIPQKSPRYTSHGAKVERRFCVCFEKGNGPRWHRLKVGTFRWSQHHQNTLRWSDFRMSTLVITLKK